MDGSYPRPVPLRSSSTRGTLLHQRARPEEAGAWPRGVVGREDRSNTLTSSSVAGAFHSLHPSLSPFGADIASPDRRVPVGVDAGRNFSEVRCCARGFSWSGRWCETTG